MKQTVLRGLRWVLGETLGRNLLLFGFTIALARLLTPADFGAVAMLSLFVGIASTLAEGGLGAALIQAKNPTQQDISTVFWAQLMLALLLASVLAASGPLIASIFKLPILQPLALAFGFNIVLNATASIHFSLFNKHLDFRPTAIATLTSQTVGGLVAIGLALSGAGPWALVSQTLVTSLVAAVLLWFFSSWRPSLNFSITAFRKFANFGLSGVAMAWLFEIETRVGTIAIGLHGSPVETGQYHRASSLQLIFARLLSGIVSRIAFPVLAEVQDDRVRFLRALREATFVNFSITAMVMWTLASIAEPLVYILLGEQWLPSAPVLEALCVSAGFVAVTGIFAKSLRAINCIKIVLIQQIIRAVAMCVLVWNLASSGFVSLAFGQAALIIMLAPMGCLSVAQHLGYRLKDQFLDLCPVLGSGLMMWFAVWIFKDYCDQRSVILQIIIISSFSLITYLVSMVMIMSLYRNIAWQMTKETLQIIILSRK